ncbi:MAG: YvcK family protein [Patescibacteria group bacterium]|nr:YvcK family protein [Patescibacteria group bacterium]
MIHPKITLIGGGTGSYTLLQALKRVTPNITALVNMADDGGSTGVLRDELGVLPPGDVRQCLVALSESSQELRDLFTFRFPNGTLEGHSFGNIFLSAVEMMTKNFEDGVRMASDILRITGTVLPITLDECQLQMTFDGQTVSGQRAVELTTLPLHCRPKLWFKTKAALSKPAETAIMEADLVIIAPGNLYASLAPALIVSGVAEALAATPAKVAFVCNLVNKPNHTVDYDVSEYASEIERLIAPAGLDYVFYNQDTPTDELLERYALEHEYPVIVNRPQLQERNYEAIGGNFLSHAAISRNPNDHFIERSLIRHDARAVVDALAKTLLQ